MKGFKLAELPLVLGSCMCLCASTTSAIADEESDTPPPDYVIATTTCAKEGDEFTLNLIFDRELDRNATFSAAGSALTRKELQKLDCAKARILESEEPALDSVAGESATRSLTLVVYSGNLSDPRTTEDSIFISEFAGSPPKITIDDAGNWNGFTFKGSKVLPHGPLTMAYHSPQTFISCSSQSEVKSELVASDYLVQVVHISCDDVASTRRTVVFFGLGSFASENHSHDGWQKLSILESAYLALEFEMHRAAVSLLK